MRGFGQKTPSSKWPANGLSSMQLTVLPECLKYLKKLFGKPREGTQWTSFWSEVSALGLDEESVHNLLGIKTMKDWLGSGKSLNQAIEVLAKKVSGLRKDAGQEEKGKQEEIPQVSDELLKGWLIVKNSVKQLNITDCQVRKWFSKATPPLEIGLADFDKVSPPPEISNDLLSNFQTMLDVYREKQEQKAAK